MPKGKPKDLDESRSFEEISVGIISWIHQQAGSTWVALEAKCQTGETLEVCASKSRINDLLDSGQIPGFAREETKKLGHSIEMIIQRVSQQVSTSRNGSFVETEWAGKLSRTSQLMSTLSQMVVLAHLQFIPVEEVLTALQTLSEVCSEVDPTGIIQVLTCSKEKVTD